jgi:Ras-related protein Rab-7A
LVYDITNEKSFNGLKSWHEAFINQSNCQNPLSFPFVLVGNKLDLAVNRVVAKRRATSWAEENGCLRYFEASAKDATGVDDIFVEVAKVVHAGLEDGEYVC